MKRALAICTVVVFIGIANSNAGITTGGDTTGLATEDFEWVAGNPFVEITNLTLGIMFGEKLVGQTNSPSGDFDVITGTPGTPLTMDTSVGADYSVSISYDYWTGGNVIAGSGHLGYPNNDAIGEGALTVLYDVDQSVIGFTVVGQNGGTMDIQFFNRAGTSLADLNVALGSMDGEVFVFSSDATDIAAITIDNADGGGIGCDNFRFVPIPEPATLLLLCLGGLILKTKRK